MSSVWIFSGLLGLYVVALVGALIKASRVGKVKFVLKQAANGWRWVVHLVWVMYFIVWSLYQIPGIVNWSATQLPKYGPDTVTYYIYAGAPYVAVTAILAVACWIMSVAGKPWIKYSEREQEWSKEERAWLRQRTRKWLGRRVASLVK